MVVWEGWMVGGRGRRERRRSGPEEGRGREGERSGKEERREEGERGQRETAEAAELVSGFGVWVWVHRFWLSGGFSCEGFRRLFV